MKPENKFILAMLTGTASLVAFGYFSKPSRQLNPDDIQVSQAEPKKENPLEGIVTNESVRRLPISKPQLPSQPTYAESQPASQPSSIKPPEELTKLLEADYLVKQAKGPLDLYLKNVLLSWGGKFPEKAEYRPFSDGSKLKAYANDAITDEDGNPLRRIAKMTYTTEEGDSLEIRIGQDRKNDNRSPNSITLVLEDKSGRVMVYADSRGKRIEQYSPEGKLVSNQLVPYQHPESWKGYADLVNFVD